MDRELLCRVALACSFLVLSAAGPPQPDRSRPTDDPETAYRAVATRANPGTPHVDGNLDDPAWADATPIASFTQRDPQEGQPATERTEARVLYDSDALYVAIRAYDTDPSKIVGRLTRRDTGSPSDWLIVSIDSYADRRTAFEFWVNPAGVERDIYRYDDTNEDDSWDAVWDVAARVDDHGWTAEFRIPFSQLRFSDAQEQTWGFEVMRIIQRKNEEDLWKPIPKDGSVWVSAYGELTGMRGIEPGNRLEIRPYMVSEGAYTPKEDGNPFRTGHEFDGKLGANIKYGVTRNLTLDLALNPDFGQVEADPSVVNLSAFETRYREKRPLFVEGANIFDFSVSNTNGGTSPLFYSRRIGRPPQGSADARGGFVSAPEQTTILGATKLSGKTSDGWSIGVLNALTGRERATVVDSAGGRHHDIVEPLTNYGVLRIQRDLQGGKSAVGGIFTSVNRSLPSSLSFLRSSAYSLGLDARHRFWGDGWEVSGKMMGAYVRGSPEAITATQESSARYFQRPDADHVRLDSTRTSLFGTAGAIGLDKISGHWRGGVGAEWVSPGFEVNDLGFLTQADIFRNFFYAGYIQFQPGKIFRRYNVFFNLWDFYTFGGERTALGGNINGSFTLLNYWGGYGGINLDQEALSPTALRGGPAMVRPGSWNAWYGINSDDRKRVYGDAGGWVWRDDERSHSGGFYADISFRPLDNIKLSAGPSYDRNHDDWAYVAAETALGRPRYVMGALEQKTVSMTTRLDWTFTPNLSLQLYAQPFVSAGAYRDFREVTDPRANRYDDRFTALGRERLSLTGDEYSVDQNADGSADFSFTDPNFNVAALRSTVVLRWEYVSGSTLFLVWQQNRSQFQFPGSGVFRPGSEFHDLFHEVQGDNIFLVKMNYYLNP